MATKVYSIHGWEDMQNTRLRKQQYMDYELLVSAKLLLNFAKHCKRNFFGEGAEER